MVLHPVLGLDGFASCGGPGWCNKGTEHATYLFEYLIADSFLLSLMLMIAKVQTALSTALCMQLLFWAAPVS